jgi:hypothetical protein
MGEEPIIHQIFDLLKIVEIITLWPVIATMLSTQLDAIKSVGKFLSIPSFLFSKSIIIGTMTAGETPDMTNLEEIWFKNRSNISKKYLRKDTPKEWPTKAAFLRANKRRRQKQMFQLNKAERRVSLFHI